MVNGHCGGRRAFRVASGVLSHRSVTIGQPEVSRAQTLQALTWTALTGVDAYRIVNPASTGRVTPVMNLALSLASHTTASLTSSGWMN